MNQDQDNPSPSLTLERSVFTFELLSNSSSVLERTKMTGIFFNADTLALSLPLLTLCGSYAFFKFVPLTIGLPLVGGVILLYNLHSKLKQRRAEQSLESPIDESIVKDLTSGEEKQKQKLKAKSAKKDRKVNEHLRQRLAAEKKAAKSTNNNNSKAASSTSGTATDEQLDEDDALLIFAKGNRATGKKKK